MFVFCPQQEVSRGKTIMKLIAVIEYLIAIFTIFCGTLTNNFASLNDFKAVQETKYIQVGKEVLTKVKKIIEKITI